MASNRRGLNMKEVLDMMEEDIDDVVDIYLEPPEVNENTDEDSGEEDDAGYVENLNSNLLKAGAHARTSSGRIIGEDCSPPELIENACIDASRPQSKKRCTAKKNSLKYDWSMNEEKFSSYLKEPDQNFIVPTISLNGKNPLQIFEYFFDLPILETIAHESKRYAAGKGKEFSVSITELKAFLGILLLSGYHKLPRRRMYWSEESDLHCTVVSKAMSRNRFEEILSFLHFTNNQRLDKQDKMAKIRPFHQYMIKKSMAAFPATSEMSFDESMVQYYGRHGCKQFIRGKPIRFGFKVWCLNAHNGYLINFDVYQGSTYLGNPNYENVYGKGASALLNVLDGLIPKIGEAPLKLFFDNLFTGLPLLVELRRRGYAGTGTIRDNRIPNNSPLKSVAAMKKCPRGTISVVSDKSNNLYLVRWKDNAVVTTASTMLGATPKRNAQRWSRVEKKRIQIDQPNSVSQYNKFMGGTDLMDEGINQYRTGIRMKKWWWALFSWMLDAVVYNSWIIHRIDSPNVDQLSFRRYITQCLLMQAPDRSASGRPKISNPTARRVLPDIRYDGLQHYIIKIPSQRRCANVYCSKKPMSMCEKCNVGLCIECFKDYHTGSV